MFSTLRTIASVSDGGGRGALDLGARSSLGQLRCVEVELGAIPGHVIRVMCVLQSMHPADGSLREQCTTTLSCRLLFKISSGFVNTG